jgi:SWI/SNF-related matrix-associated actin-dependent regulator of chromatin subfamily A protein 2/4
MQGLPQAGQGQSVLNCLRLPNGQLVVLPPGAPIPAGVANLLQQQQQQQQALLMQQQMGQLNPAMLAAARPGQQPTNAGQLAAVNLLQQRLQAQGAAAGQQGAAGNANAAALALQQQRILQAQLLARQQQAPAAVRPAAAVPEPPQMGFTPEQLVVLKEQIMLFKTVKKGSEVKSEALEKCRPPPLPAPALPQQQALIAPLAGAVRPAGVAALQQHVRPPAAALAAVQQQQLQQQLQAQLQAQQAAQLSAQQAAQLQAAGAAQQQQQQQQLQRAAQAQAQQRSAAAGARAGQAAAAQAEAQTGPSTPPMDLPVRRWAGPLLSLLPPAELARKLLACDMLLF